MAKGKNLNPAEAFRKTQKKKELKKNKEQRQKNRDLTLVKKDTANLEDEIEELEKAKDFSSAQKMRLNELKSELARINKKKEEYVEQHPEHRNLVFRRRRDKEKRDEEDEKTFPGRKTERRLFDKNGLPRHPERSIYYDPVMNPYGVPPPGMPYVERPLLPGEVDSEEEASASSEGEDDIAMPEGPPPGAETDDSSSDEDNIPMPEGPPLDKGNEDAFASQPPLPPEQPPLPLGPPPLPPGLPPPIMPPFPPTFALPSFPPGAEQPVPPPPPLMSMMGVPPFPPFPPPGFSSLPLIPPTDHLPPPPPGFYPRRVQAASTLQDPLSSIPHQTYQAYRESRRMQRQAEYAAAPKVSMLPQNPNLPRKPPAPQSATATVSAEPQLRDLKKESTAFVPAAVKRKKAGVGGTSAVGRVNAAPSLRATQTPPSSSDVEADSKATQKKPDLLDHLKETFGPRVDNPDKVVNAKKAGLDTEA